MNKKTPEIRFKGFSDDWEQRKLGEEVPITMGQSPSSSNYTDNPNDYILVQGNADVRDGKVKPRVWTTQVTKTANRNDIVLSVRAPVGDVGKTDYDIVLGRGVAGLKGNEFIYQTLTKMKINGFWDRFTTGSTFESINSTDLKNAEILIPNKEEQLKIGFLFATLDKTIALHQQKIDLLKQSKKSFLQNLFPKKEKSVPDIRFSGFVGEWEQRKLEDVAEFNPKSIIPLVFKYVDLESVVGTEMINFKVESRDTAPSRAQRLAQQGDVFYQTVRPYQKNNYLFDMTYKDYVFSTGYAQMRPNIDSYFLFSRIQENNFVKTVLDRSTGTSYPAINSKDLANIEVKVPNEHKEQMKVGNLFKQIDNTIALHQEKIESLKQMKKALLQKLFI